MVIIHKGRTLVQGSVTELLNSDDLVVSFRVDNVEQAKKIATASQLAVKIDRTEDTNLFLHISQDDVPTLNKLFCDQGLRVFSIETKRKLEDYFLKLTGE